MDANGIADEKKVPTLLTVIGAKHYSLIQGLVSPTLPRAKTLEELEGLLKKHYDPEPIVIAQRFHFYQRSQKPGETIAEYLASLRQLASRCKFRDFLSEALRDRLVCGLQSQKSLLSKADLTLESAVEVSQSMEAAAKKTKDIKANHRSAPVMAVASTKKCGRNVGVEITMLVSVNSKVLNATNVVRWGTLHLCADQSLQGSHLKAHLRKILTMWYQMSLIHPLECMRSLCTP